MSMEVTGIPFKSIESPQLTTQYLSSGTPSADQQSLHTMEANPSLGKVPFPIVEQNLKELEGLTKFLNRRLKFSFNEELQQVVVKIVDGETDKVIKVLPPEEVQKLHLRIRETLGILFDQLI